MMPFSRSIGLRTALLTVLVAASAAAQGRDSASTVTSVLAFEDARFSAMVRADTTWLRDAFADDVSYVHTTARSDTKAEYLKAIADGSLRYEALSPKERRVRLLGPTAAVIAGLLHARALATDGALLDADVRYTAVYERFRNRWRLVAWQTTRVP